MPVYRPARVRPRLVKLLGTEILRGKDPQKPDKRRLVRRYMPHRNITGAIMYPHTKSRLTDVSKNLRFQITAFVDRRASKTGQPAIVVDWGCGEGNAAEELAGWTHLKGRVKVIGTSKDSYDTWSNYHHARFIHETAQDQLRYFRNNSVDLIYSNFGLSHFFKNSHAPGTQYPNRPLHYIAQLIGKLKQGGKLVFNLPTSVDEYRLKEQLKTLRKELRAAKLSAELEYDPSPPHPTVVCTRTHDSTKTIPLTKKERPQPRT